MAHLNSEKAEGIIIILSIGCFSIVVTGIVLVSIFAPPHDCPNLPVLSPGFQASCCKTTSDIYHSVEVASDSPNSSLITYVFDKEPNRTFFEKNYSSTLNEDKTKRINMRLISGAVYNWKIDVDVNMDIYFRTPKSGKVRGYVYYKESGVSKAEGSYSAKASNSRTYFLLSSSKPATGTFSLTVDWPQWNITSINPVDECANYPCKWVFSDTNWKEDSNLWIVTVNNGTEDYGVSMVLKNNQAIWITIPVIMIVLPIICFFVGVIVVLHSLS